MKRCIYLLIMMVSSHFINAQVIIPVHNIHFAEDQTSLSGTNVLLLEHLYNTSPNFNFFKIHITGKISTANPVIVNEITFKRAQSVFTYFMNKGVNPNFLNIDSAYFKQMMIENSQFTKNTYALVDIAVYKEEKTSANDLFEYFANHFSKSSNNWIINPNKDNTMKGNDGTEIFIPKNSFECEQGGEIGKIKVELKEYYSYSDIIKSGLSTSSNNTMLETGGMIYLEATCASCENQKVFLVNEMEISFPFKGQRKYGMRLFDGNTDDQDEIPTNWVATESYDIEEEIEQENDLYEFEGMFQMNKETSQMQNYIMTTSSLGWINCDRFYDEPNKQNILVKVDSTLKLQVCMIFKDIKSVMNGYANYTKTDEVLFNDIPRDKEAYLIAYVIKNKQPYFGVKQITTGKKELEELVVEKQTMASIELELKKFNSLTN